MYDKSTWLMDLHSIFKTLDRLTSEQSYRRLVDNVYLFDELFAGGASVQEAYEEYWTAGEEE